MSQAIINLTDTQLVANAIRTMGWSQDVATDSLDKARAKFSGEALLVALRNMGYFG